jgi:3-methyladenine DNA glycosylase Tag
VSSFEAYWQQALSFHHDERSIKGWFPSVNSENTLTHTSDSEYLSHISRRVFRAGMKHSLIDQRWPAFEEAFWGFNPEACQLIDDARFEVLMQNKALIRHWGKMKTIPINAQMVADVSREHGGFGKFLAQWPGDDIVGLWTFLKMRGSHLGGDGGARFLRMVGKDTFVLSDDVVRVLINEGLVSKKPTSQKDLQATQQFFNALQAESQLPLSAISMVLALSIGPS